MVGGKLSSVRYSVLVQGPLRGVALGAVRQGVDSNGHQFSLNSMSSVGALGGAGTGSSIVPSSPSTALSTGHCARHMRVPSRLHMATAVATVNTLVHLICLLPVDVLIWVRVAHEVLTDALEDGPVVTPVHRPRTHVVVGRVVDHTSPALAGIPPVDVEQQSPVWHTPCLRHQ